MDIPKTVNIEKYDFGNFEKEGMPFAMLLNEVIQKLAPTHPMPFAIWSYLQSLPPNWIPNKNHIIKTFNISKTTYHRHMKFLVSCNLVEYLRTRSANGRMSEVTIKILNGTRFILGKDCNHVAKNDNVDSHHVAICPDSGEARLWANGTHINTTTTTNTTEEKETERENARENEISNIPKSDWDNHQANYELTTAPNNGLMIMESESAFECFWELYPRKKSKGRALAAWMSQGCFTIAHEIITKLAEQVAKDREFIDGYAPNADRYIMEERWNDEISVKKSGVKKTSELSDYDREATGWGNNLREDFF